MVSRIIKLIFAAMLLASCGNDDKTKGLEANHCDSLIFAAGSLKHYDEMLALTDSFETQGGISSVAANRWRGAAYYHLGQYRTAEYYFKHALEGNIVTAQDQLSYTKSARRLSELLLLKGDYEGSLEVAMPAVKKMQETGTGSDIDYAILLNNIGICQLHLGRDEDAYESFITARGHYINRWTTDTTGRGFQEAVIGTVYTSLAYIDTKRYADAIYWIDRTEMLLGKYRERPDARFEYFDEYQGRIEIMRAVAKLGMEEYDEAAKAYDAFLKTSYSKTNVGRINADDYLLEAGRFGEAADNYRYLSQMVKETGIKLTLDNIQRYLLPKLRANAGALRKDTVVAVAMQLCDALDSAIVQSKHDDSAELAIIYNTGQKEAMIAQQQADLSRQRWVSTMAALVLIVVFFSLYTYHRRKAQRHLAIAHEELQTAYDKLEETTTIKERIESELRIARDIQMSMVPNIFPDYEGLDIYASMTPAKEVGGDLYGYLMIGDNLYFCIGDVSGKGVPASLFMAQATRLFRTLASQRLMPADIANRMNAELSENNEQGMFVTMFFGLVNLKSGKMEFCNAGHNPPLLIETGEFLEMEPNAPIGLWPELEYIGESIENIKDKLLFFYTDGLNEAENKQQQQFGDEHLQEIVRKINFETAKQVVDILNMEVERHRNGADPNDDITMLCLKVKS